MNTYLKTLSFPDLLIISIGHIIGAGIFTIIGKVYKYAGNFSYISVILAGLFMYWISKSYTNIVEKYKSNDSEFKIIKNMFGEKFSFYTINLLILGNIISCVILAISFGSYFSKIINVNEILIAFLILCTASLFIISGINITKKVSYVFTILEVCCLIFIIIYSFIFMNQNKTSTNIIKSLQLNLNKFIKNPFTNLIGILIGSYLILFAYFGFETIIRISEESKDIKDIQLANNYSFGISTLLYVLLTICLINNLSVKELGNSNSPLSDLIYKISKNNILVKVISTIAVGSIFNTIILILLANSRLMSSMYKNNKLIYNSKLLNFISEVKNNKPKNAVLINLVISISILLLNNNIVKLTSYTNLFLLIVPILVKIIDILKV